MKNKNLTRFIIINNFLGSLAIMYVLYEEFPNWGEILASIYFIISIFTSIFFMVALYDLEEAYNYYLKKEKERREMIKQGERK